MCRKTSAEAWCDSCCTYTVGCLGQFVGMCMLYLAIGLPVQLYYYGRYEVWAVKAVPERVAREKAWGSNSTDARWLGAQCSVLEVGVAYRGGCDEMEKYDLPKGLSKSFAECPGTSFCAEEGGICKGCGGGDVLYADYRRGRVDNHNPTVGGPVGDLSNILHDAPDEVPCGQQPKGLFKGDPKPGSAKACFCTPRRLVELARRKGPLDWRGERCSALADRAFAGRAREVGLAASSSLNGSGLDLNTSNAMALPDGWCNMGLSDTFGFGGSADLVLLPWALVEVVETDPQTGRGTSKLRCAYKYGAPAVSLEDARPGQGPSGAAVSDWSHLTGSYREWKSASKTGDKLPCSVRSDSILADSSCAVALSDPAHAGVDDPPSPSPRRAPLFYLEMCIGLLLSIPTCTAWLLIPLWMSLPLYACLGYGIAVRSGWLPNPRASAREPEPGYQRLDDEAGLGEESGAQNA